MNLSFDHRESIAAYLDDQAAKYEAEGMLQGATVLRAHASNTRALLDVKPGTAGIVSSVRAIIIDVCNRSGGPRLAEVVGESKERSVLRVRWAAMWVAKKRLGWSDERLAGDFNRDRTTIASGVKHAEEMRRDDAEFRALTDAALGDPQLCENCQHPLVSA